MKFAAFALAAMTGAAYAAPVKQAFTLPGGDHDYHPVARRSNSGELEKRVGAVTIAVASVLASAVLGFIGGPVGNRVLNDIYGVQKKRSIRYDVSALTADEARDVFISHYVDTIFKENPNGGETDAAVCTSVGYRISDPSATLDATALKFTAGGQETEYDCFLLAGPVTFEVNNATDAQFAWEAPANASFADGVLTIV